MMDGQCKTTAAESMNAFCVDLEDWFHSFGIRSPYSDPHTWDHAPSCVVSDTEKLLRLLDDAGVRATFLTLGWVAQRYPDLVRRLAREGHEVGCHTHHHRLVFETTASEFEQDLERSLSILRDVSGQPVDTFRAPGFSIRATEMWAYPILRRHGVTVDLSIVPARRDHGGIASFGRDPCVIRTAEGDVKCVPNPVMTLFGRRVPFAGGGYLRLFPEWLIRRGFAENHAADRACVTYIHPREMNPAQPRLPVPKWWRLREQLKYQKYYVNLASTPAKLRMLLRRFRFGPVRDVLKGISDWPVAACVETS
jgi:polysaccharide deacetylase family protein (PEP-CTERM system associated)